VPTWGAAYAETLSINNVGQVAGFTHQSANGGPTIGSVEIWFGISLPTLSSNSKEKIQPALWTNGKPTLLPRYMGLYNALAYQVPLPAGQLLASARISSNGWVAGTVNSVDDPYGRQTAFLFKDGVWRWMPMSAEMALVNGTVQRVVAVADGGAVLLYWQAYNASKEVSMLWKGDAVGPVEALLPPGTSVMPGGASAGVEVYDMNDKGQILAEIVSSGSKRVILSPVLP
jgi:hypothetical protein